MRQLFLYPHKTYNSCKKKYNDYIGHTRHVKYGLKGSEDRYHHDCPKSRNSSWAPMAIRPSSPSTIRKVIDPTLAYV